MHSHPDGPGRRRASLALLAAALLLISVGCGSGAATSRPDPDAPCAGADEQRAAGLYPDLEALLPARLPNGEVVRDVQSGRYCSARTLGSLLGTGIAELRFAGGQLSPAADQGVALTVYTAPGLTLDALADSFAQGAGQARRVTGVRASELQVGGARAIRIDAYNAGEPRVVVVWESARPGTYRGVLAGDVPEERIRVVVDAIGRG
jgi:hypothetical protein